MTEQPLWTPSSQHREDSNLNKYATWLKETRGLDFRAYEDMWRWSTEKIEEFWSSMWEYFQINSYSAFAKVLEGDQMPDISWFKGSTLNYAEHLFRFENDDTPALIFCHEQGEVRKITWQTLRIQVSAIQHQLRSMGVKKGDRVVAVLPNIPEAIYAFIATNSLGAIWSCCSPDFGSETILERFSQVDPKVLIAVDGYTYNNKSYDRLENIKWLQKKLPTISETVLVPYLDPDAQMDGAKNWPKVSSSAKIEFLPVPFDHPIWILYSSGTTGKPKAITHSHGGMLLEHLKYMSLQNDVKKGEHFFWFSTTGWMMWNFLQSAMLVGGIPVLYDGSPIYPDWGALWQLTQDLPIHHFGTSAPYLTALMKSKMNPRNNYALDDLRSIGSTGAPLPPDVFDWIYEQISPTVWLCSMSGGTDVCTAFVGGIAWKPVFTGRIQGRALGCALHSYTSEGKRQTTQLGEMVIEKPMPCMPVYFWNDPNKTRYLASYFSTFPGIWRHGDFIRIFGDGSLIIEGRSDATLNRKGIRIGTAEIYNALADLPGVVDALIVNIEQSNGEDIMPLFIRLEGQTELSPALKKQIIRHIRSTCSPRHVPDTIIRVSDIPYTLSGKKMEVPVKKLFVNKFRSEEIDYGAIRNPEAMRAFARLARSGVKALLRE